MFYKHLLLKFLHQPQTKSCEIHEENRSDTSLGLGITNLGPLTIYDKCFFTWNYISQLICIIKGVRESRAYLFAFYAEKKTILRMNYVKRLTCRLICILHCLHVCAGAPQVTRHLNFDQSWPYRHSMFDSPYFHYICNGVMA